jgi:hypothetical protein
VNPLRKNTAAAVSDILAVVLILIGTSFSFGDLLTTPADSAFGEATSFYGTPLQIAREALADYGAVPMWNMRTGAGESLVANPLAIHFYPLAFIALLSQNPALDGVRALAFIHLVGAALAIYMFARVLGAKWHGALVAPALFILNAHTGWRVENGIIGQLMALLWLPITGTLAVLALRKRSIGLAMLMGVSLAMMVLAGTVYDAYFAGIAIAVLFIAAATGILLNARPLQTAMRPLGHITGLAIVGVSTTIAVSAVKTIPVAAFQPFSTRVGFTLEEAQVGLDNIPTYTKLAETVFSQVPTSFIGGLNILAVLLMLPALFRRTFPVMALFGIAIIGLWASLGTRAPLDLYAGFHGILPGFAFNNTTIRFMNLFYFAFAGLAAIGLSTVTTASNPLLRQSPKHIGAAIGLSIAALITIASVVPMRNHVSRVLSADAHPTQIEPESSHAILSEFQARDGAHSFRTFSTHIFGKSSGRVSPASSAIYQVDTAAPANAHMVPSYQLMTDFSPDDATARRQAVLASILNSKYFVYDTAYDLGPSEFLGPPRPVEGGSIYENKYALNRVHALPSSILFIGTDEDQDFNAFKARLLVFLPDFDLRSTAILHGGSTYLDDYELDFLKSFDAIVLSDPNVRDSSLTQKLLKSYEAHGGEIILFNSVLHPEPNPFTQAASILRDKKDAYRTIDTDTRKNMAPVLKKLRKTSDIRTVPVLSIDTYSPNEVKVTVGQTNQPTAILLSQMYFPGWTAEVNGKPATLLMANSLIMGAIIGPGNKHELTFRYSPGDFYLGSIITLASLALISSYGAWRFFKYVRIDR